MPYAKREFRDTKLERCRAFQDIKGSIGIISPYKS
jgi:hypothetical protein